MKVHKLLFSVCSPGLSAMAIQIWGSRSCKVTHPHAMNFKPRLHCQPCVALLLNTHSKNSKLWVVCKIQWLILVYSNSVSDYGPYCIDISCVSPFISSLTSVCSVKVSHMTDSVYPTLGCNWHPSVANRLPRVSLVLLCIEVYSKDKLRWQASSIIIIACTAVFLKGNLKVQFGWKGLKLFPVFIASIGGGSLGIIL